MPGGLNLNLQQSYRSKLTAETLHRFCMYVRHVQTMNPEMVPLLSLMVMMMMMMRTKMKMVKMKMMLVMMTVLLMTNDTDDDDPGWWLCRR